MPQVDYNIGLTNAEAFTVEHDSRGEEGGGGYDTKLIISMLYARCTPHSAQNSLIL